MHALLCIIPARGGSKRFPKKNIVLFNGKPLVGIAAEVAKASGVFQTICVSSDDKEILRTGGEYGADYQHTRSERLASDHVQLPEVCRDILDSLASEGKTFDSFAILTPMNPLRSTEDILAAEKLLTTTGADAVISLATHTHSPRRALAVRENRIRQYFSDENLETYTKEERLYYHDAAIVFVRTEPFLKSGKFHGPNVIPYFTPPERSVNIDYPIDLAWAEFLLKRSS